MLIQFLLVVHIAITGYWLGAEFVINSTSRYVAYRTDMPFIERDRLWDHAMSADQHVRYALILQAMLGAILGALYGFLPGGEQTAWGAVIVGLLGSASLRSPIISGKAGLVPRSRRSTAGRATF